MMNLEIYTPEKTVFKGGAEAVILPGTGGQFEVLKGHAPLISTLKEGELKVTESGGKKVNYMIKSGFVEVLNNNVNVLVEDVSD